MNPFLMEMERVWSSFQPSLNGREGGAHEATGGFDVREQTHVGPFKLSWSRAGLPCQSSTRAKGF